MFLLGPIYKSLFVNFNTCLLSSEYEKYISIDIQDRVCLSKRRKVKFVRQIVKLQL